MEDFFTSIADRLGTTLDPSLLGSKLADLLADAVVAAATFLVFYLAWRLLDRALRPVLQRTRLDATAASFVRTVLKFTLLVIGAVNALNAVGIDTAAIIASLGIAGLTIGFAARDAVSNIISGVFIFWDRPFVIGDLIEVEGNHGKVDSITLRSTRVVTGDGKMLAIPNATIVNTTVASYTNFPHQRVDVDVTIGVHEDIDRARSLLLGLVARDPDFLADPAPRVVITALGDYNVTLELRAWVDDERSHGDKRLALREALYKTFTAAGVDMPFQTIQLIMEK